MLHFDAIPAAVRSLLDHLAPQHAMRDFLLGGGTSLALRFGHRLSVDLDFFTTLDFTPESVFEALSLNSASVIARANNTLGIDVDGVKVDLLRHNYPLLEAPDHFGKIAMVSLPDLAAMKLNAIANRGSKKDFFDLIELLKHFPIRDMIDFFTKKYPTSDSFTVIRSLAWFEDADLEPDPIPLNGLTWDSVKSKVSATVNTL